MPSVATSPKTSPSSPKAPTSLETDGEHITAAANCQACGRGLTNGNRGLAALGLVPQELATDMFEEVGRSVGYSRGLFGLPSDPARIEVVDLALTKKDQSSDPVAFFGQVRTLDIEVTNQGTIYATEFTVADYIPCGFEFTNVYKGQY